MIQLWRALSGALPFIFVSILLAAVYAAALLLWRRRKGMDVATTSYQTTLDVILAFVVLVIVCITLLPQPTPSRHLVLMPLHSILSGDVTTAQMVGNVVMFIPLGCLLPLRWKTMRTLPRLLVPCCFLAVAVEGMQAMIPLGRIASSDDVLLNLAGATVGAIATSVWWSGRANEGSAGRV